MAFRIRLFFAFVAFICTANCETRLKSTRDQTVSVPIGMIYNSEDDLTQRAFQDALDGFTGHDPTYQLIAERLNEADQYQVIQAATRLLKRNVLAIVVPSTRGSFSPLVSLSANTEVPLISLCDQAVDDQGPYVINLGPNTLRAALDVMRWYRWENTVYFYDKDDGPARLQHITRLGSSAINLNILGQHKIQRPEEAASYLRKAENDQPNSILNVVLDVKPSLAASILSLHARSSSTSKKNIHFLVVEPVDHDFFAKNTDLRRINVTILGVYNPQNANVAEKLADLSASNSKEDTKTKILLATDTAELVDQAFSRMHQNGAITLQPLPAYYQNASSKFELGHVVKQYLTETYVPEGLTGTLQVGAGRQRRNMNLYVRESTPQGPVQAFTWTELKSLIPITPAYSMEKTAFLEKKTLVVTSILSPPYIIENPDTKGTGNDRYSGYAKELMDLIANDLGFDYEIVLSKDRRYGTKDITGKWSGMIGEIINHEADIALSDITITASRQEVVDFSIPYMTVGITMLIKKPGGDGSDRGPSASSYFFLHIFTMDVWGCIIVSFIGVGVLYFFVTKLTSVQIDPRTGLKRSVSVFDSLWFSFGSLVLHNTGLYSRSISSRFLTAIWWLFVIFVATLYVSGLVSMLLVELFGNGSWNNYKALASKTTYSIIQESLRTGVPEIGCINGGSTMAFFKNSNNADYKRLDKVLNDNPEFLAKSNANGVLRVQEGGGQYAFLMESASAQYISFKQCDLAVVSQQLDSKGYGIAFAKGSPYREMVNKVLQRLMEAGELQNLYLKWWIEGSPCFKNQERSYLDLYHTALTLKNLGGLFYCLITGVVLTLFITAIEYCVRRRRRGHHSVALTQITKGDQGDLNGDHEINHSIL